MNVDEKRAAYYKTLCSLQKDIIGKMHKYIHGLDRPRSTHDATPREWDLAMQCYFLKRDNEALHELCDEYRKRLEEYAAKIN